MRKESRTLSAVRRRIAALLLLLACLLGAMGGTVEAAVQAIHDSAPVCDASHCHEGAPGEPTEESDPCNDAGGDCCKCPCHGQNAVPPGPPLLCPEVALARVRLPASSDALQDGAPMASDRPPRFRSL